MKLLPQRVLQHQIDYEACKLVSSCFDTSWEIRDLTGRDFGIDKVAERFENRCATGELILLQIKGTKKIIDGENPRFSLDTKTLLYAEMFSTPFLLVYCSISNPKKCYYLWLQEYIRVRLNFENEKWKSQDSNTIYFPDNNILGSEKVAKHLTYVSKFPKYKDSWVEYYSALEDLCYQIPRAYDISTDLIFTDKGELDNLLKEIERKLSIAASIVGNIPSRFIPDCLYSTIKLCQNIINSNYIPSANIIQNLLMNCHIIESSVVGISQRFNSRYLRTLYEVEKIADF